MTNELNSSILNRPHDELGLWNLSSNRAELELEPQAYSNSSSVWLIYTLVATTLRSRLFLYINITVLSPPLLWLNSFVDDAKVFNQHDNIPPMVKTLEIWTCDNFILTCTNLKWSSLGHPDTRITLSRFIIHFTLISLRPMPSFIYFTFYVPLHSLLGFY